MFLFLLQKRNFPISGGDGRGRDGMVSYGVKWDGLPATPAGSSSNSNSIIVTILCVLPALLLVPLPFRKLMQIAEESDSLGDFVEIETSPRQIINWATVALPTHKKNYLKSCGN